MKRPTGCKSNFLQSMGGERLAAQDIDIRSVAMTDPKSCRPFHRAQWCRHFLLVVSAIAALALVGWILFPFWSLVLSLKYLALEPKGFADIGPAGDFVGGLLNPVLSLLAFIALLVTIAIQLSELRETRKELAKSSRALERQQSHLATQNFENKLFSMVAVFNDIISRASDEKRSGADFFRYCYHGLRQKIGQHTVKEEESRDASQIIGTRYKDFFEEYRFGLSSYFRYLYRMFKFVDEQEILNCEEKKDYIKLIRAQLSDDELALLMYSCFSEKGRNMIKYIVKYDILDNLDITILACSSHLELFSALDDE